MKYLRKMNSLADYQLFAEGGGTDYVEPHVVYIPNDNLVKYKRIRKITTGDIVYFNGTKIKTIEPHLYNVSLGYPLGVIVIPPNMLPDGKARYCSIYSEATNKWGPSDVDTPLDNYEWIPIFNEYYPDGVGVSSAYLPSDYYNETRSADDPKAFFNFYPYGELGPCTCPSPYLGDDYTLNPNYITEKNFSNVFTDFNGLSNTRTLVGLGTEYKAAVLANNVSGWIKEEIDYLNKDGLINYNSDLVNIETYLPSMGELGFFAVRYKRIRQSMEIINREINYSWGWGFTNDIFSGDLSNENNIFSSTEMYEQDYARFSITHDYIMIGRYGKESGNSGYIVPFAILE